MSSGKKRTALLLGASKGLGFGVADAMTSNGTDVILVGRNKSALQTAETRLRGRPGIASSIACDLSSRTSVEEFLVEMEQKVQGIDILLLNGGGPPPIAASKFDLGFWEAQYSAMFLSQIRIATHILPEMRRKRFGRVIAVSSTSVREPIAGLAASNALRAALAGWAKTLATEVASDGVTVNLVLPGRFATERTVRLDALHAADKGLDQTVVAAESQREIPAGRYGRAEEFGAVVSFLSSAEASYITGVALPVDGGLSRSM